MATQNDATLHKYPGFVIRRLQHPNGLFSAVLYRQGNPIAKTDPALPVPLEVIMGWSERYIAALLQKEVQQDG